MLEIYKLLKPPLLYPRKLVRTILNPDDLIKKMGWTKDQVSAGLNGDVVNNMVIQFSDHFLRRLAIDEIISESGTHTDKEVAQALGISHGLVRVILCKARKKFRENLVLEKKLAARLEKNSNDQAKGTYIRLDTTTILSVERMTKDMQSHTGPEILLYDTDDLDGIDTSGIKSITINFN